MPMAGHSAETGQVVAVDFRHGNVPPAKDNKPFIQQCQQSLPEDCTVKALRIDAAGYPTKVIEYCDAQGIEYAIRAQIAAASTSDWQPLLDKKSKAVNGQDTYRISFCIGEYGKPFTLIIQRTAVSGQASLDLDSSADSEDSSGNNSEDSSENSLEEINAGAYIYRGIATNREGLGDSEIIHWPI